MESNFTEPHDKEKYKNFVKGLKESEKAKLVVNKWLQSKGYETEVKPLEVTPNWQERKKYSDKGDIFLLKKDGVVFREKARVEAKRRPEWEFVSLESIPFNSIIVNSIASWDDADPKPKFHFCLNRDYTYMLVIDSKTSKHWFKKKVFDGRKQGSRWCYFCPKDLIKCIYIGTEFIREVLIEMGEEVAAAKIKDIPSTELSEDDMKQLEGLG